MCRRRRRGGGEVWTPRLRRLLRGVVGVVMQERDVVILCLFFPTCPDCPGFMGSPFVKFYPPAERTPALALGTGVSATTVGRACS